MATQHLIPGIDPTGIPDAITKADLLEMWTAAKPVVKEGLVIWSQTPPNVVLVPEFQWYFWAVLDGDDLPTGDLNYYYNGAWTAFLTFDGSKLRDGSVTLAKITGDGAVAYDVIQRNAANNAWTFISVPNAIQNNSLPPTKLVAPDGVNTYVLMCVAGVKAFKLMTYLLDQIGNATFEISKLVPGGANTFMRTNVGGSSAVWGTADISDLLASGYLAGQGIRRNAGNTGWEPFTATAGDIVELTNGGALYTLPLAGAVLEIPHEQASIPRIVNIVLQCVVDNNGYVVGDQIALNNPVAVFDAADQLHAYTYNMDATNITLQLSYSNAVAMTYYFIPKAGGNYVAFDPAKWKAKVNFIL